MAIDPGPRKCAAVCLNGMFIDDFCIEDNVVIKQLMKEFYREHRHQKSMHFVIEQVASYGMPVGEDVFETCRWAGEFRYICKSYLQDAVFLKRKEVVLAICNTVKASDANVRQAIIDRYPATGGGKVPQIGITSNQGPLYGISKDCWQALALGIAFMDIRRY